MHIYVMRHGDAILSAATDAERPLSEHGKVEVATMAKHLIPFSQLRVLVSPYKRAQQTADILLDSLEEEKVTISRETLEFLTPNSDPALAIRYLEDTTETDTLIVAHQPLVDSLISMLIQGALGFGVGMTTACIAKLETPHVGMGTASLIELARP